MWCTGVGSGLTWAFGFAALAFGFCPLETEEGSSSVEFTLRWTRELTKEAGKQEEARDRRRSGGGGGSAAPTTSGGRSASPDSWNRPCMPPPHELIRLNHSVSFVGGQRKRPSPSQKKKAFDTATCKLDLSQREVKHEPQERRNRTTHTSSSAHGRVYRLTFGNLDFVTCTVDVGARHPSTRALRWTEY